MLKPGVMCPREDKMGKPKLFDAMEPLHLWRTEQFEEASRYFNITMDRIPYNLMIFHKRSLWGIKERVEIVLSAVLLRKGTFKKNLAIHVL